jgi:hypothetical protein
VTVEDAVWSVMLKSDSALTGLEVSQRVGKELLEDIRGILNRLHKSGQLESIHGGGGRSTVYFRPRRTIDRRL